MHATDCAKKFAFLSVVLLSTNAFAQPTGSLPIPKFAQVTDGIYRGSRPGDAGLDALAQLGVKTDLDLEDNDEVIKEEMQKAQSIGMDFISMPMSGFFEPKNGEVNEILGILASPANFPIYVHCQHGEDRTGLIVGLYRVEYQGWSAPSAYAEMMANGFHPILLGLHEFFEDRTGYDGPFF